MRFVFLLILSFISVSCAISPKDKFANSELSKEMNLKPDMTINDSLEKSALTALNNHDYVRSLALYEQLIESNPDNIDYTYKYAEGLRIAGQYDLALEYYEKYLNKKPDDINAIESKGLTYMAKADFSNAINNFKIVLAHDKNRWKTMNAIALSLIFNNRFDDGIKYFHAALRQDPSNISVRNNLALAYATNGEYEKSLQIYNSLHKKLSAHDPALPKINLNRALIYAVTGNLSMAEKIASKHLNEANLYNNMGVYSNIANDRSLARSYLNKALFVSNHHYIKAYENLKNFD